MHQRLTVHTSWRPCTRPCLVSIQSQRLYPKTLSRLLCRVTERAKPLVLGADRPFSLRREAARPFLCPLARFFPRPSSALFLVSFCFLSPANSPFLLRSYFFPILLFHNSFLISRSSPLTPPPPPPFLFLFLRSPVLSTGSQPVWEAVAQTGPRPVSWCLDPFCIPGQSSIPAAI